MTDQGFRISWNRVFGASGYLVWTRNVSEGESWRLLPLPVPGDYFHSSWLRNGEVPEFIETEHFFLDLPALADTLGQWLRGRADTGAWRPNVIRFSKNILDEIRPRAMTRDIDWGVTIPLEGWRENPSKKLYVWFDAVIGYLSASIEWARRSGDPEAWRDWWNPAPDGEGEALSYYFMGKDNIVFHSQIWPAELLAYDGRGAKGGSARRYGTLNLPTEVVSSEFLTMEGKKFSSSKKVVIYVRDLLSRYQPDAFRYFVAAAGPENQDSDFTWAEFVRRTNDELVAGWGNLVNRTANLIAKNFGEIPAAGELTEADRAVLDATEAAFGTVGDLIERHRQKQAIGEAMRAVAEVNKYVSDHEPWKLKDDAQRERLGTILHVAAQCVNDLNVVLAPFLPFSANLVDQALGGSGAVAPMPRIEEADDLDGGASYPIITGDYAQSAAWGRHPLEVGRPVAKPKPVFVKLDTAVVEEELARLGVPSDD
jgi:methionyl-tRNA synthetase